MTVTRQGDDEQARLWNGPAGHAWVEAQELLDRLFQPFEDVLVDAAMARSGHPLLDVGCGTGGTTLAAARRLGAGAHCVGIDISAPMIAKARARAEREDSPASFIHADAQTYAFAPARFDMIISRFGVMFFDDSVQAFTNLRRAARDGAELRFIAWRHADENPFMTTAERAAASLLPNIPARRPDAPGQFAFADQGLVRRILEASGWRGIDIRPLDAACSLPKTELMRYITRLGPLGMVLHEAEEETRTRVITTVHRAFDPYVHGSDVRFTAACWLVGAWALSASAAPQGAASA